MGGFRLYYERRRSLELLRSLRVAAAGGGGRESCVAAEMAAATEAAAGVEGFADEEDYVKAGGSEMFYVKMQERKPMGKQSKIGNKVLYRSPSLM